MHSICKKKHLFSGSIYTIDWSLYSPGLAKETELIDFLEGQLKKKLPKLINEKSLLIMMYSQLMLNGNTKESPAFCYLASFFE